MAQQSMCICPGTAWHGLRLPLDTRSAWFWVRMHSLFNTNKGKINNIWPVVNFI